MLQWVIVSASILGPLKIKVLTRVTHKPIANVYFQRAGFSLENLVYTVVIHLQLIVVLSYTCIGRQHCLALKTRKNYL